MKQTKPYNQKLIRAVIENGQQPLYEIFNNESVERILSGAPLEKTLFRGKHSQKSLSIKSIDAGQDLACIFGLDWTVFADKYLQATSGDGQEARRIRTLHSSSLLCLLCFYGVSEERPLNLIVDGRQVRFTSSQFEVKNPVGTDEKWTGARVQYGRCPLWKRLPDRQEGNPVLGIEVLGIPDLGQVQRYFQPRIPEDICPAVPWRSP